jgi:hypothetical protein
MASTGAFLSALHIRPIMDVLWTQSVMPVRKRSLFSPLFILKMITLPRQARDKHKGKHPKTRPFSRRTTPSTSSLALISSTNLS